VTTLPHDIPDLYLAPVALAVDGHLNEFGALGPRELVVAVALESDCADWTRGLRQDAILRALARSTDLHGWTLEWDPRGIRLTHEGHSLVLGVPANVEAYRLGVEPAPH
jgi:hypothetical protein